MRTREVYLKTGWHLLIAATTIYELSQAQTTFRRMLLGGCAGWHLAGAWSDWIG